MKTKEEIEKLNELLQKVHEAQKACKEAGVKLGPAILGGRSLLHIALHLT